MNEHEFSVFYSEEDGEWVAKTSRQEFLSWLAPDPLAALAGLLLVLEDRGKCARCGREDTVMGSRSRTVNGERLTISLCHANPDGTKADPDCYTMSIAGRWEW